MAHDAGVDVMDVVKVRNKTKQKQKKNRRKKDIAALVFRYVGFSCDVSFGLIIKQFV
jgi:hypothetical protein